MKIRELTNIVKNAYSDWSNDNAASFGAALAYYTVFSFPPLLLIAVTIAGFFFGQQASQGRLMNEFQGLIGQDGAQLLQTMIQHAADMKKGFIGGVIGVILLLFGASGVFIQLQTSLNIMWGVKAKPKSGLKHFILTRFLSFAMILSIGFLLLVSLVISSLLSAFGAYLSLLLTGSDAVTMAFHALNFIISFGIITLLFALMYKFLPDVKIRWRDVWLGAIVTAFLFTIGKYLIGLYLGHSKIASTYGAAGSLAIILVWIYYSAQILFFGAEFTKIFANRYGEKIIPATDAVRIEEHELDGDSGRKGSLEEAGKK